ncbi:MAG: serine/threonine-protein phosphatase, partial [Candidatus Omnitrophica bacterium]|nr:serine/threonine-protein phosphatase [Candidatus Omnitrophota bacterium]
ELIDSFLPESGLPLGIMGMASYDTFTRDLKIGDKFLLYTDGISESRDKKGEEFGEERIKEIFSRNKKESSQHIVDDLKDKVGKFSKGLPQFDDITLILLAVVRQKGQVKN